MCARFPLLARSEMIEHLFDLEIPVEREVRYNIAPTQQIIAVVEEDGKRVAHTYRWGLVPGWAKGLEVGTQMINARSEKILENATYKKAFESRRCAIPCSGFYEWREQPAAVDNLFGESFSAKPAGKPKKEPLLFFSPAYEMLTFAGLWSSWKSPEGPVVVSCTILTTTPNEVVRPFHDRMPCLLTPDQAKEWIAPLDDPKELRGLLSPFPDDELEFKVVDSAINSSKTEAELAKHEAIF